MRRALLLTLASNGNKVMVVCDNIAFAIDVEEEDRRFTRIFLKQVEIEGEAKWVDVTETPEMIAKTMR